MHVAARIFLAGMIHVRGRRTHYRAVIEAAFIGMQAALVRDVVAHDPRDGRLVGAWNVE